MDRLPRLALFLLALAAVPALAQERIYRCGNEYTNTVPEHKKNQCKLISGGNVTVVTAPPKPPAAAASAANGARPDAAAQRARDADARQILETELAKAQARREELLKEYNNGEPEKLGPETRNHQKYLDRVAGLKASIERIDSDIAGIQRELNRLPASK